MPVVGREVGPLLAAVGAQSGAVRAAQRGQRQRQHQRVADGLLEVDVLVDDPGQLVGVGGLVGDAVRVGEQLRRARPRPRR